MAIIITDFITTRLKRHIGKARPDDDGGDYES